MAKLQKGFQDYFRIPILLKPIGQTPESSVLKFHKSLTLSTRPLTIDDRFVPVKSEHSKLLLKRQKHAPQNLHFRVSEFSNEWSQFQVIYRCRFCVGVFQGQGDLAQEWAKACKACMEENRRMVGLVVLTITNCNFEGIKEPFTIIPPKIQQTQLYDFLETWLFDILPPMEDYLCYLISQLQKEDNGFIVFNKAEQKPEPRTLKRKKKGRCLKICGDFCLNMYLIRQAYMFYVQAEELLRKVDDYLWVMGCGQGKMACFTTDFVIDNVNKQTAIQSTRVQLLNLGKKIKVSQLQTQNYFKILKTYTKIIDAFQDMSRQFLNYVLNNYSTSEKFSILTQLAFLYKQAGMIRKHNYVLFLSSRIAMDLKPNLVGIILNQILQSKHIKQWPLVNANVIKLMIDNTNQPKNGQLHLALLQNCCSVLTEKDVDVTLESLERKNFKQLKLDHSQIIDLFSVVCVESQIKPKVNAWKQQSPTKTGPGFFMNWRKKQVIYKFQQQQKAVFQVKIRNKMNFPIRCSVQLIFSGQTKTNTHPIFLQPRLNKILLSQTFTQQQEVISLQSIKFKLFNSTYQKPASLYPAIKLQIYEQYPEFNIDIPDTHRIEESSLFEFPLTLTRNKQHLNLENVVLLISVYYTLEIGFQETTFLVGNLGQTRYLVVLADYPYQSSKDGAQLIRLQPLKVHKKYIKKIQFRIDAVRSQRSKYQISKKQTSLFVFQRSIWCQLISITTPMKVQFNLNDDNIIQDKFILKIALKKKKDDLTPYKITQKQTNCSYILSESTTVIVQKILPKRKKTPQSQQTPVQITFHWCNSTRQKQCGTIPFQIPPDPKMFLSQKQIHLQVDKWNRKQHQQLKCPQELKIVYRISCQGEREANLNHIFVVEPLNLRAVKKYVMVGKTRIKGLERSRSCPQNVIKIRFFYQYKQEYMLGLKFEDHEVYWFPCRFSVTQ